MDGGRSSTVHTPAWRLVKRCKLPEPGGLDRSLSRSFSRPNQPKGARRPSCAHADRPARDGPCMHPHKRKRVPFMAVARYPITSCRDRLARMPARGAYASCMPTCGVERPPSPCCRASVEPQEYVYHGTAHQRRTWRTSLSPPYRQCTCRFATVYNLREWCGVRAVMCTCAQYQILRARASICQFAGRPPSIVPTFGFV